MLRRFFLGLSLCLVLLPSWAALTPAQRVTLKAYVLAEGDLAAIYNNGDLTGLAAALNAPASPAYTVWKSSVTIRETGQAFNGSEWAGMTTANHTRLQTVAQYLAQGYNPSAADVRAMFNDIWSGAGGATTRANLLVLWKRVSTRLESVFASGAGTDGSPSTLVVDGSIQWQELVGL